MISSGYPVLRLWLTALLGGWVAACGVVSAQSARLPRDTSLATVLTFEGDLHGSSPAGWGGGPVGTIFVDDTIVHSGKHAVRIERNPESKSTFSTLTTSLPIDFTGQRLTLRGYVRTENVSEFAGLWMREDGQQRNLAFDNMQNQQLRGTTDWKEYSISLPLHHDARVLVFGFLVGGTGKAWVDDLQLLVDGKPIWEAPKVEQSLTVIERDHAFDHGSKIALHDLTPLQIENLATLARIWGFLKYHHPRVSAGEWHWDYELFRVMPDVLAAGDRAAAAALFSAWIERLGPLTPGPDPAVPADSAVRPDLTWLDDRAALGERLSAQLRAVHAARSGLRSQFYVSFSPNVRNPVFDHELDYPSVTLPDTGFQLLALFRFWNIIRYWAPDRELVEGDWDAALTEFIPRFAAAGDAADYHRALLALIARVRDTHANLWSGLEDRPPVGDSALPIVCRFVEGQATVVQPLKTNDTTAPLLQRGDVLLAIDGTPIEELVRQWTPYYAASNEPTRLRDIARALGRGPRGPAKLQVRRGAQELEVEVTRVPAQVATDPNAGRHDLPGDAFRLLSPDVAYLKLSAVKGPDIEGYVKQALGTKGWIIDIRNYPSAFTVFALGGHLVEEPTAFARFTFAQPENPGCFAFGDAVELKPLPPHYAGKVVVLVDEVSQSQAEYTAMAFRAAPGAIVIGSTTAGADGNLSTIPLPGGQRSAISGLGVFYPDKRPTQRIGIVPDIEVRPTLAGICAGRDEVLEAALRQILGAKTDDAEIRRMIPNATP